jgi:hypothetical protein
MTERDLDRIVPAAMVGDVELPTAGEPVLGSWCGERRRADAPNANRSAFPPMSRPLSGNHQGESIRSQRLASSPRQDVRVRVASHAATCRYGADRQPRARI